MTQWERRKLNQLWVQSMTTFFESRSGHDTWLHFHNNECYQIDHFLVSTQHIKYIVDARKHNYGAPYDHTALALKMKLPNFKFIPREKRYTMMKETKRINNRLLSEAWSNVYKETIVEYVESRKNNLLPSPSQGQTKELGYEKYVIKIEKKTCRRVNKTLPWLVHPSQKTTYESHQGMEQVFKEHLKNKTEEKQNKDEKHQSQSTINKKKSKT